MDLKELVQRQTDMWNARDREGYFATFTDDYEVTAPGFTGKGRQGLQDFWSLWTTAFPDNQVLVGLLIADGDHVAAEGQFDGTHTGPIPNPDGTEIPATGKHATQGFTVFHTAQGDKVATSRFYFDQVDLLTQLGLMPG